MRKPIIAGNWKMNSTIAEALALVKDLKKDLPSNLKSEVIVSPPYLTLHEVANELTGSSIRVAGQDLFWEEKGAFTGAVSGLMLKDAGADAVIIGHSECREYFHEKDETVNKKIHAALHCKLRAILCVGETLEEREAGQLLPVVERQVTKGLKGLTDADMQNIIIAYEPVWAIGTGKTATGEQAENAHLMIRSIVERQFNQDVADKVRILYGGSVKPNNAAELLAKPNIDGALVGGASLKANDFIEIIKSC
ncbi:MAG: triose-phosphate isomerase [Gammaproteobacteria bacterium]|nr:triose-phosphate isomerase [Gammaproteobacteria bacterium]